MIAGTPMSLRSYSLFDLRWLKVGHPCFCARLLKAARFPTFSFSRRRGSSPFSPAMSETVKTPAEAAAPGPRRINTRAAGVVGLAVMCSRLLGLARELILAKLFGAGFGMD